MNIVLFGPPGSGKGTQADLLAHKLHIPHLSTGNTFRAAIQNETPIGLKVKAALEAGKLVNDHMVLDLVAEELQYMRYSSGAIYDGFPRTVYQAEKLDELLAKRPDKIDAVFSLEVPEKELIRRTLSRGQGRKDDTAQVIHNRLEVYRKETAPVLAYYKKKGLVHHINGIGDSDKILNRITSCLVRLKNPEQKDPHPDPPNEYQFLHQ